MRKSLRAISYLLLYSKKQKNLHPQEITENRKKRREKKRDLRIENIIIIVDMTLLESYAKSTKAPIRQSKKMESENMTRGKKIRFQAQKNLEKK